MNKKALLGFGLILLSTLTILVMSQTAAAQSLEGAQELSAEQVVYQLIERHLMLTQNKSSVAQGADILHTNNALEVAAWLKSVQFPPCNRTIKGDIKKLLSEMVKLAESYKNPPTSGFDQGYRSAEAQMALMPVLADFSIDVSRANRDGHPALASHVDNTLSMAWGIMVSLWGMSYENLKNMRPDASYGAQYLVILERLTSTERNSSVTTTQAALLHMNTDNISNLTEREILSKVHSALLELSLCRSGGVGGFKKLRISTASVVCKALDSLSITDYELEQAGGERLVQTAIAIREKLE